MGTPVNGTTTTVTGLTPGTQYRFRVRAKNIVGYGPFSQWSIPGTPTGGLPPSPPPPTAIQVSVQIYPVNCSSQSTSQATYASCGSYLVGSAAASGSLANVSYTWQGRWYRVLNNPNCYASSTCRFTATVAGSWATISPSTSFTGGTFYYRGSGEPDHVLRPTYVMQNGGPRLPFPPNYWDIRLKVTGTLISDGQVVGPAEGYSRVIPFKEYFHASYDFPTDILTLIQ